MEAELEEFLTSASDWPYNGRALTWPLSTISL
jgi:hypothetical protein